MNITLCQCSIPDNVVAGDKTFTVKVVQGGDDTETADLQIKIYDAATVKITGVSPVEFVTGSPSPLTFHGKYPQSLGPLVKRGLTIRDIIIWPFG